MWVEVVRNDSVKLGLDSMDPQNLSVWRCPPGRQVRQTPPLGED